MKIPRRRLALIGFGVVVLGLLVVALWPKPVPSDFAEVTRGSLRVTVDEEGETRVRDRFLISAPLAGRVLRIELEPGDPVVADETILATFQPSAPILLDARARAEAEARLKAARAALGRAKADRQRAEAELDVSEAQTERSRRLRAEQIISQEQLDLAELDTTTKAEAVTAARFAVRTAEHDLEVAKAALLQFGDADADPIVITSPIDGVVLQRLRESEAVVPAGEPLLEVADPAHLEIVADMLSTDAVKVTVGDRALIEQWGGTNPIQGTVRRVEPFGFTKISALGVEEQRVNVIVDITDDRTAWEALGDGYRVEIRVVIWEEESVLKVPTGSLFREAGDWACFVVEGGRAVLTKVEIGQSNGLEAQVLSGLEEGAQVVAFPSDTIEDGVGVKARS